MRRKFFLLIMCALALVTQLFITSLASVPLSSPEHKARYKKLRSYEREYAEWTLQTWNKNDAPYLSIRKNIDLLAKQNKLRDNLARYASEAQRSPQNPKLQFRWAYATWIAKKWLSTGEQKNISLYKPRRALLAAPFPETFQYARLLFLLEAFIPNMSQSLMEWPGSKIYAHDPKDLEVKYYYARIFGQSAGSEARKKKALQLLAELQRANPKETSYIWAEAQTYETAWNFDKYNQEAGNKAVEAYQRYMKAAKLNAQDSKRYEDRIAYIRSRQKLWADYAKQHPEKVSKR